MTVNRISLVMDDDDFALLVHISTAWAAEMADWEPQIRSGRFESGGKAGAHPHLHWKRAYWVGEEYTAVILAVSFLISLGFRCEVVADVAEPVEWVILTDYETPGG